MWSADVVFDRTADGRALKGLTVVDDATTEAVAVVPARALGGQPVTRVLDRLALERGLPGVLRTDNALECCGRVMLPWHTPAVSRLGSSSPVDRIRTRHGVVQRTVPRRVSHRAGPAPAARRIGNRFPPPPLFLHDPGRFEGTQVEPSRLDGCRQTLDVERVRPQTTRRQLVTETRSNGFDSRRRQPLPLYEECFQSTSIVQGSVRLGAGRRTGPHAKGSTGTSCAAVRLYCASVRPPCVRVTGRRAIVVG